MRSNAMSWILAASLLTGAASAQQASYTHIPQPPPHYNPFPPLFTALNTPVVGTTFQVSAPGLGYGCACYPSYFLMTGFTNPDFDMTVLGPNFRGVLMTSAEVFVDRSAAYGPQWIVDFPIPASSTLIGFEFFQQIAYLYDSPTFGPSVLVGRGGHGVIGT